MFEVASLNAVQIALLSQCISGFLRRILAPVRWVNELIRPLFGIQSAFVGGQSGWGVAQASVGGVAAVIVRSASISAWLAPSKLNPGTL